MLVEYAGLFQRFTVSSRKQLDFGRKLFLKLGSDSRSAKYVLWSNFVLILWKLFGLLSFGFFFGNWFGRKMEWESFLVMLCNQKEACSLLRGRGLNCFCIIPGK